MRKPLKLKTKIVHTFDVESDLMDDLDFNINIQPKNIKKKIKIIEVKRKTFRTDASTRLF